MRLLFRDAFIIDGTDHEPFIGYVLVNGKMIEGTGEGKSPFGGEDVDREIGCQGRTLLPGFINCHVHLSMDSSQHPIDKLASLSSNAALIEAMLNAKKMLLAGFTTVRDCGGREEEILALRDAINSGLIEGPRIVASGQALKMTGGHYIGRVVDGPGEVRKAAREMIHKGADFIKVIATGGVGKPGEQFGAQEFFYDELSEAFGVARMANKPSAAHVHGLEAIRDCIRAGVTSVEHGTFIDAETAEMMAEKDVFLVPTFAVYACMAKKGQFGGVASHMMDSSKTILEAKVSRFRYALNAGVKIAFGTDAGTPLNTHEDIVTEAQEMVEAGASNMTVIKSLTDWAAKLVKLDMVIGSISQGKVAELILLDGNPLEDIAALGKVVMVVKEGCIVRG